MTFLSKRGILNQGRNYLYTGILGGMVLSGTLAFGLYYLGDWLDGLGLIYFEALLFFISAILMVHMVFWMRSISHKIKNLVENDLQQSLGKLGLWGIALIASLAIGREGAEVAIYLYSMSLSPIMPASILTLSTIAAFSCSIIVGYLIFKGSSQLNLAQIFKVTTIFLLITAGSFLLQASYRVIEAGFLPATGTPIWDSSHFIPLDSRMGSFLNFFAGYTPSPPLLSIIVYCLFWASIWVLFRRGTQAPLQNRLVSKTI